MNELIEVVVRMIGEDVVQTVNARELHAFLENGDNFTTWIKQRIEKYGFVENQDFVSFWENTKKPHGGRPAKEYAITLDMAKELAMVERNDKGREARRYFIERDRRLRALEAMPRDLLDDPAILRAVVVDLTTKALGVESRMDRLEAMYTEAQSVTPKAVEPASKVQPPSGAAPDRMTTDQAYLTPKELSTRWQISHNTLRNWRFKGVGPRYFKPVGKVLYKIEDVRAWEEAHMFWGTMR